MKNNIKIYSTPSCIYCRMLKDFLKKNEISFEEFDVSKDEKAQTEMVEKSQQLGVPVIDIDGEIIVGFDKSRISQILNLSA